MSIDENLVDEPQLAQKLERGADAGFLWDFWYPAVRSAEIRGRGLVKAMLLEVPLVLGRTDDGHGVCVEGFFPHTWIPLSYGRLMEERGVSYHGWKFDGCSGQCVEIPSLTSQDKLKGSDFCGALSVRGA